VKETDQTTLPAVLFALHVGPGMHSIEEVRSCAVCEHYVSLKKSRENTALLPE
jgi:hypothetical protein